MSEDGRGENAGSEKQSRNGNGDKPPRSKAENRYRRVLGPVPNLEEHVRPDWWRGLFNSIYLKTDGDVVDDRAITGAEIDLFMDILKPSPDTKILDLCCGQGRHSLELARRGLKSVEGMDRSHYLVQRARSTARREGLPVKFKEGDARKLPYPADAFDVVLILGNSFGYFETIHDDLRVLKEVFRVLKPWGRLLLDVADGKYLRKHFQKRSWEWVDRNYFVCRERSLSHDGQRLISREVVTHVDKGVIADQFYAERLYTQDSLVRIVAEAGFGEFKVHTSLSPDSRRNQDLGMMEQRIIATAQVKKEWTSVKRKSRPDERHIAVLLGDPRKPDALKPLCVFDEDDFYTIDQMKAALREIPGYRFSYFDSHDSFVQEIRKSSADIDLVLNLCDEGFMNDPRKELHLPAMLEMLGVPYTGAGPQCLAYCYDKSLVRGVAKEMTIPVPEAFFVKSEDTAFEVLFGFPVLVKPNFGDSSYGITRKSVAYNREELLNAVTDIREKFGYEKPILVEELLTGKDITVGIIGNSPSAYTVLPIIEEDYSALPDDLPKICGYEAKWLPDSPYWQIKSIRADLPDEVEKSVIEWCLKLFERLECRDYARFDWRLNAAGMPKLLEVNPNPGWCWDGHLAKMARLDGISYRDMLWRIIQAAELRLGIMEKKPEEVAVPQVHP